MPVAASRWLTFGADNLVSKALMNIQKHITAVMKTELILLQSRQAPSLLIQVVGRPTW